MKYLPTILPNLVDSSDDEYPHNPFSTQENPLAVLARTSPVDATNILHRMVNTEQSRVELEFNRLLVEAERNRQQMEVSKLSILTQAVITKIQCSPDQDEVSAEIQEDVGWFGRLCTTKRIVVK